MSHLHDWRHYAQEKEEWPAPAARLRELREAMQSRMFPTRSDQELAEERARMVVVRGAAKNEKKEVAQMGWDEYRQYLWGNEANDVF